MRAFVFPVFPQLFVLAQPFVHEGCVRHAAVALQICGGHESELELIVGVFENRPGAVCRLGSGFAMMVVANSRLADFCVLIFRQALRNLMS